VSRRTTAAFAAVAALVVLVDQVAKYLVRASLPLPGTSIPVIGHLVRFTHTRNEGAAFGMLPGNRYIFIGVSVLVVFSICVYLLRWKPERPMIVVALGLVAGGAIGNLIDRVWRGFVTDFIQWPLDFPVFNVADSAIVIGVSMLIWWLLFGPTPEHPATDATPAVDAAGGVAPPPPLVESGVAPGDDRPAQEA